MLLPPHIKNMTKAMVATLTPIARQRSQWLVKLVYIDDKAKEGNENDSEN